MRLPCWVYRLICKNPESGLQLRYLLGENLAVECNCQDKDGRCFCAEICRAKEWRLAFTVALEIIISAPFSGNIYIVCR